MSLRAGRVAVIDRASKTRLKLHCGRTDRVSVSGRIDRTMKIVLILERGQTDRAVAVSDQTDREAASGRIDRETETGPTDRVPATDRIDPGAVIGQTDRAVVIGQTDPVAATGRIDRETGLTGQVTIDPGGIDRASDRRTDRISAIGPAAETALGSIDQAPATGRRSTFSDRPSGHR